MRYRKYVLPLLCVALAPALHAQSFDLEQFDQLFRPRIRLDAQFASAQAKEPLTGTFDQRAFTGVFTFPLHSKWSVAAEVDLTSGSWKELLEKSVRVRARQVMGNVRIGTRGTAFDALLGAPRRFHTASAGALGINLTRRFRVLFWSANVNVSEEDATFGSTVPRVNGLIGKMHVKGLRKQVFYGLAASWSDGVPLAIPFVGGQAPIGERWLFQYVLPLQLAVTWRPKADTRVLAGVGVDGWRSGFDNTTGPVRWEGDDRINLNYAAFRGFIGFRHTLNTTLQVRAELAYAWHDMRASFDRDLLAQHTLEPGPRVLVGANILFGDDLFERIMDLLVKETLR